jgi:hypothetical protein
LLWPVVWRVVRVVCALILQIEPVSMGFVLQREPVGATSEEFLNGHRDTSMMTGLPEKTVFSGMDIAAEVARAEVRGSAKCCASMPGFTTLLLV